MHQLTVAQALAAVLQVDDTRDAFEATDGPRLLLLLLYAAQSRHTGAKLQPLATQDSAESRACDGSSMVVGER